MINFLKRSLGIAFAPAPTTKDVWIDRCARRYASRSNLTLAEARPLAGDCWNMRSSDHDSPEDAADEDMTYWASGEGASHG